eukprot:7244038-Alexandrium_andersonii.AAC.1
MRKAGYQLAMSPCNPESTASIGGVAIAVKCPIAFKQCEPRTDSFLQSYQLGRAILGVLAVDRRLPVMVCSFYGWASDTPDHQKNDRTASLMTSVFQEVRSWPEVPTLLMGDLNASAAEIGRGQPRVPRAGRVAL